MAKDPEFNYSVHSMDEIVFEKRNKAYGAFFLRNLYKKNLLKASLISVGSFILATVSPMIVKHLGWGDKPPIKLDTMNIVLQAPPSLNPMEPASAIAEAEVIPVEIEQFQEMQATDKEELRDTANKRSDLAKKNENNKLKPDSSGSSGNQASNTNGGGKPGEGKIWNHVERLPEFMGGEDAYEKFMTNNMTYPEKEEKEGIEGVAKIYFVVNADGSIEQVKVLQSSGNVNLDAEAVRLIKLQPKYRPGTQKGIPVRVSCVIRMTFQL